MACPWNVQPPSDDRKPAWRRACLAYREIRDAGGSDQQAHEAAVEATLSALPIPSHKETSAERVNAIAYATKYHSKRFLEGRAARWKVEMGEGIKTTQVKAE